MGRKIEEELSNAGFKILGKSKKNESLIIEILETANQRYLKAIPFMLYTYEIPTQNIYKNIFGKKEHLLFSTIVFFTKKIFRELNIKKDINQFLFHTQKEMEIYAEEKKLNYEEFKGEFILQLKNNSQEELLVNKQTILAERGLEMQLSQIFTPKEKEIIKKIINEKPIGKTEYEYYSRKTKKKINSIIGLYNFAQSIKNCRPIIDEKLFLLKRKIEHIIGEKTTLRKFFIWKNELIAEYSKENGEICNVTIPWEKIITTGIKEEITHYKEHAFV